MPELLDTRSRRPLARAGGRGRAAVGIGALGVLVGAVLAVSAVAPAQADPLFAEGDCVVSPISEGGPGGAQCPGVDLSGTRFGEGDFRTANLTGASFAGGDVQGAVFEGAVLDGADFSGTRIVGADFTGSSILPGQLDLEADGSGSAPVPIQAALPAGLTLDGCAIAGTPVESGQPFPIGTSTILCTISSSFPGTASARLTVNVVASPTATPTQAPLFTPEPAAAGTGGPGGADWIAIGGWASVAVLVGGAALMIVTAVRGGGSRRRPGRVSRTARARG
ncbi:pentapeptide repeat-containing protein [Herbiconiux sp. CPCC 205716]|uniref:Pentapeptide repeat-containing protein n=1 Tax=Herbiconiux gentiana TaxID=2970912 RepID=A0ABT2GGA0_9MICO|nr:pentapeptide repeat-containing protein [Herbiconiux gentiana]MCS5715263.1 pentapeptide repeat-containing protein [Herbiconiux gentiana]